MFALSGQGAIFPGRAELTKPGRGQLIDKNKRMGVGPRQQLSLEQCLALARCSLGKLSCLLILQKGSHGLCDSGSKTGVRRILAQRVGIGFPQSGLALCGFPAARLSRHAYELAGRQHSVYPFRATTTAIAAVRSRARRVVTCINAKHWASRLGLQVGSAGGTVRLLYDSRKHPGTCLFSDG